MQTDLDSTTHLLADELVGFPELMAALTVTEDDVVATHFAQHQGAYLPRERALQRGEAVLRSQSDRTPLDRLSDKAEEGERRTDDHADSVGQAGHSFCHGPGQFPGC